jgi:hypothetical protein
MIGTPGTPEERFRNALLKRVSDLEQRMVALETKLDEARSQVEPVPAPPTQEQIADQLWAQRESEEMRALKHATQAALVTEIAATTRQTLPPPPIAPEALPQSPYSLGCNSRPLNVNVTHRDPPKQVIVVTREKKNGS